MNKENRTEKRVLGDLGEDIACKFLQRKGFSIIERNYLRKWGEIDIIAEKEKKTRFIEVKSVSREIDAGFSRETEGYRPEDNLHPWKLLRLSRTIQTYLASHTVSREMDWQFDVITVYIDKNRRISKVFMLENVIL
ncbi:MAG: YraN family protein [Patescibacteria group bacterium]|nr:YraN family protein [Patescibacteria group bacterium]MDE1945720.1 YraN family protein [Patescibacteria group bacterium]